MRHILLFLLIGSLVMAFIFADHFPGLLARYPRLQELNGTVRGWLNMDNGPPSRLSDHKLKETDQILLNETPTERRETEPELPEYHD